LIPSGESTQSGPPAVPRLTSSGSFLASGCLFFFAFRSVVSACPRHDRTFHSWFPLCIGFVSLLPRVKRAQAPTRPSCVNGAGPIVLRDSMYRPADRISYVSLCIVRVLSVSKLMKSAHIPPPLPSKPSGYSWTLKTCVKHPGIEYTGSVLPYMCMRSFVCGVDRMGRVRSQHDYYNSIERMLITR